MRVLMLTWEYPPYCVGGLGKHVSELVPALAAEGVEVHLVTPRFDGGELEETGTGLDGRGKICIYRVEPSNPGDFYSAALQTNLKMHQKAYSIVEQHGPFDLIHVHDWMTAFAGEQLKQHFKLPLLATIHATERGRGRGNLPGELPRAINNIEWWLTYEAWRVICCSQYMSSEVREYFETPADKIDVIPNGVTTDHFDRLDGVDLSEFRKKYAAPDQKIIFYVGRIVEEKGLRVLIQSAPGVLAANPKTKFVVAGTGPQLPALREQAKEADLSDCFYFTGFISDDERDKLYKVADVAVFPSLYEPFGIVALEAMAARVPVVVADTGGLTEVVTNHQTGIVVYPNNSGSLAWGINHTLSNAEWSKARVENAYLMVRKAFNWRRIARETIDVYRRLQQEYRRSEWGAKAEVRGQRPEARGQVSEIRGQRPEVSEQKPVI